jgi:hypothetical protein
LRVAPAAATIAAITRHRRATAGRGAARARAARNEQEAAEPAADRIGEREPHRRDQGQQHERGEDVDLVVERVKAVGVVAGRGEVEQQPPAQADEQHEARVADARRGRLAHARRRACGWRTDESTNSTRRRGDEGWKKSGQRIPT